MCSDLSYAVKYQYNKYLSYGASTTATSAYLTKLRLHLYSEPYLLSLMYQISTHALIPPLLSTPLPKFSRLGPISIHNQMHFFGGGGVIFNTVHAL